MLPERVHKERQMRPCSIHVCSITTCGSDTDNEINQIFFFCNNPDVFLTRAGMCVHGLSLAVSITQARKIAIYLSTKISLYIR